jgi:hypothetical protein
MGVEFKEAENVLEDAVKQLFGVDPSIQSVGIGRHGDGCGFRVVKNAAKVLPQGVAIGPAPSHIGSVPVTIVNSHAELRRLVKVPASGPGSPGAASVVPEQLRHNPLVCGLQIQNFDDDSRQGEIARGFIIIGTLGCFVKLASGEVAILSNNHVVAGQNRGVRGSDRILHPGGSAVGPGDQVATLNNFIDLVSSPAGASPALGTANLNDVDAGIATLDSGVSFVQGYLASRGLTPPKGTAVPSVGDAVFKVGRTTALTHGTITDVSTTVGPVGYDIGDCWFRRSITIEGVGGTLFSDHGDSGSAILDSGGEVVAILYAGNGTQTYACPIGAVLSALGCTIA